MRLRTWAWAAVALLALAGAAWADQGCPMCKEVLESAESGGDPPFNSGIFFMLALVYAMIGLVVLQIVRHARPPAAPGA